MPMVSQKEFPELARAMRGVASNPATKAKPGNNIPIFCFQSGAEEFFLLQIIITKIRL